MLSSWSNNAFNRCKVYSTAILQMCHLVCRSFIAMVIKKCLLVQRVEEIRQNHINNRNKEEENPAPLQAQLIVQQSPITWCSCCCSNCLHMFSSIVVLFHPNVQCCITVCIVIFVELHIVESSLSSPHHLLLWHCHHHCWNLLQMNGCSRRNGGVEGRRKLHWAWAVIDFLCQDQWLARAFRSSCSKHMHLSYCMQQPKPLGLQQSKLLL